MSNCPQVAPEGRWQSHCAPARTSAFRTARLFDEANVLHSKALPELLDVRLLAMSPHAFTLTGF
jgi:hypothetical protein